MEFTYAGYANMISLLRDNGYAICGYNDWMKYDKCVILRHDEDSSLGYSLNFAEFEQRLGVKSTYFIMLSTDHYNISSAKNTLLLRDIKNMGHDIGLHFDEARYAAAQSHKMDILQAVEEEIAIMTKITDIQVSAVSMHMPSRETLDANYEFKNAINSYSQTFFKDFKYLSDSSCHWREPVIDIIKSNAYKRLHILTHPFWYNETELSAREIYLRFIKAANYERYIGLRDDIPDFDEFVRECDIR